MIRSAVTVSLVPEAQGGPFVFWHDLPAAIEAASRLGFDAIEVFAPGPDAIAPEKLGRMLKDAGLRLAAVGTGAGWVKHKLTLTDSDPSKRRAAHDFIQEMIEFGAAAGTAAAGPDGAAPAIIGSMQGRWGGDVSRDTALAWLAEGLNSLGEHASSRKVRLLYEPLNRYETNLVNTLGDGSRLLRMLQTSNVRLLADLYHMNIEESDSATSLALAGDDVGHIHFVDSNRRPAGNGHIDYAPIASALAGIKYDGYASAEAIPWPDPLSAAQQTIKVFRRTFRSEWSNR
jgi:sugar phosphate isomerase/epimerase